MKQMIALWYMVMIHGLMVAGPSLESRISQIVGSRDGRAAWSLWIKKSNVVDVQAGYLARLVTEAPETQIYFINHRSGAFPALRLRTVVRGERASRSIVNRTTALWSIGMVASLILAGLCLVATTRIRGDADSSFRAALTGHLTYLGLCPSGLNGLYH
jgi:hypothetical protein